jgi:hypothetical protein
MSVSPSKDSILNAKHFPKDNKYSKLKLALDSFIEFNKSSVRTADSSTKTASSYTPHSKDSCEEEKRIITEGINLINLSPRAQNTHQFTFGQEEIKKAHHQEEKSKSSLLCLTFDLI